ncbi:MAG: ribonuclease III domain-containing protein [Snowella sp.]|nr:ribonuclease III domain-containing protein [Snowella sp.]
MTNVAEMSADSDLSVKVNRPSDTIFEANLAAIENIDQKKAIPLNQLSPSSLAYLGDAVYELYVRTRFLLPPKRVADYHHQVVAQVRAESQAASLHRLEPHLTEIEKDIVRRGRNAASGCPRRLSPELYQQATSLETLLGYLYLNDPTRLQELLKYLNLSA